MNKTALSALGLGIIAIACGSAAGGSGGIGTSQQALEALVPLQGCGAVETYVRERMTSEVNRYFDAMIENIEKETYGSGCYYPGGGGGAQDAGASPSPGSSSGSSGTSGNSGSGSSSGSSGASGGSSGSGGGAPPPAEGDSKAGQSSGTNNQVTGVDEADFIKNDGTFLYVVANGALRILKAFPAAEAGPVSKVAIEGEPRKLFVEGDRALVYVAVPRPPLGSGGGSKTPPPPPSSGGGSSGSSSSSSGGSSGSSSYQECTYGYDCVPSGDGTMTKVLVFDIANRSAPQKIRELELSGSLLSARRVGTAVHTVVVDPPAGIEGLEFYPKDLACDNEDAQEWRDKRITAFQALRAKNLALIAKTDVKKMLPSVKEGGASAVPECSGYYRPNLAEGRSFTSVLGVDIGGGPLTTATVVSDPGVVYASETGLYMSVPHRRMPGEVWYDSMGTEEQASTVHKFRIGATPSLTGYEASGIVKGRVLNQFALDEHEGHLRVATTTGHAPDSKTHSTMNVLERQGPVLALKGKVDNIAPSEDIRSVRFDGSRGFVVTFKKTDPLYVFDLGNPTAPSITGELKIPGFSTYMHMMDASHLLTIGYDADDQGSFSWFTGVMLQIFDVSDMKNPKLAHKEVIGTRGSSSEALTNHLAFTYFAPKNLLALPMTICEDSSGNGSYGMNMTFSGLMVYDTTATGGFALRGKVAHPQTQSGGYDSSACSNWWTQARSEVKRSVIMDDWVYSISDRRVKVNALANLGADIAEISLEN